MENLFDRILREVVRIGREEGWLHLDDFTEEMQAKEPHQDPAEVAGECAAAIQLLKDNHLAWEVKNPETDEKFWFFTQIESRWQIFLIFRDNYDQM